MLSDQQKTRNVVRKLYFCCQGSCGIRGRSRNSEWGSGARARAAWWRCLLPRKAELGIAQHHNFWAFCHLFCLPGWRSVRDTEEGEGRVGAGRDGDSAGSILRHHSTCSGFPILLSQTPMSHGERAILAARLLFWATTLESGFSPLSPNLSISFVFLREETWPLKRKNPKPQRNKNQRIQRDGFQSLRLYQLKETCLGFSAPCMHIHLVFLKILHWYLYWLKCCIFVCADMWMLSCEVQLISLSLSLSNILSGEKQSC